MQGLDGCPGGTAAMPRQVSTLKHLPCLNWLLMGSSLLRFRLPVCASAGISAADTALTSTNVVPREMINLAAVNIAWGALIRLLTATPPSAQLLLFEGV